MADKNAKEIDSLRKKSKNKECMDCHEKVDLYINKLGDNLCGGEFGDICLFKMCWIT